MADTFKFVYYDRVKVLTGFYRGSVGRVRTYDDFKKRRYVIRLESTNKKITVVEDNLKLVS